MTILARRKFINFSLYTTILAIIALFALAFIYIVPAEDAVILYEYAKTLASEGLISYGGNSFPIEGATDFLWMLAIAALKKIGINEFFSSLSFSLIGCVIIIKNFQKATDRTLIAAALLFTPFLYAALTGFSVLLFTAWYILTLSLFLDKNKHLYISILFLCLIRPDGVFFGIGLVIAKLLEARTRKELLSQITRLITHLVIPGLLYFLWRYQYFGELLPLPFYVKTSSADGKLFIFYTSSLITLGLTFVPFLACFLLSRSNKPFRVRFLAILLPPILFYLTAHLQQNIGNRFMAPLFFGGALLVTRYFGTRALLIMVALTFFVQIRTTLSTANYVFSSRSENILSISKQLDGFNGRMLISEAGNLAYYSNWFTEDSWGLNTPRFAKNLISSSDIRSGNYDLIVGHCNLELLKYVDRLPDDSLRTWDNMCRHISTVVREDEYTIVLTPFWNDLPRLNEIFISVTRGISVQSARPCFRHDIFAVSNSFAHKDEILDILKDHGGVLFSHLNGNMTYGTGDKLCRL